MSQSLLIHCRRSPYKDTLARGAIELAMAAAVFDQDIHLLFSGDGIWQLLKGQQAEGLNAKSQSKLLSALPLYGVESILVDQQSLLERSLTTDDLCMDVRLVDNSSIKQLLTTSQHVLNF